MYVHLVTCIQKYRKQIMSELQKKWTNPNNTGRFQYTSVTDISRNNNNFNDIKIWTTQQTGSDVYL